MLRLMTWISLRLGRRAGRCVLPFIVAYFLLFAASARRASRIYLRRALGRSPGLRDHYRHVHTFASTIHDRIYLINDRFDLFDIEVHGSELITDLVATGTWRVSDGRAFRQLRSAARARARSSRTQRRDGDVRGKRPQGQRGTGRGESGGPPGDHSAGTRRFDAAGSAAACTMAPSSACSADRTLGGDATVPVSFLGEPAALPTGPFRIAAMLRQPVIFMTGMYLGGNRYRIHFESLADFSTVPAAERKIAIRRGRRAIRRRSRAALPRGALQLVQLPSTSGRRRPLLRRIDIASAILTRARWLALVARVFSRWSPACPPWPPNGTSPG